MTRLLILGFRESEKHKIKMAARKLCFIGFYFSLARYDHNGTLDPTFGISGKVTTDLGGLDTAHAIDIQGDGKILVSGHTVVCCHQDAFALARYNVDGTLDSTFGTGGKVITDFNNGSSDSYPAIAIQADGKIVLVGTSNIINVGRVFAVTRYNPDGTLDLAFGTSGKVLTDFGSSCFAHAIAIQIDGNIIAAGVTGPNPSPSGDFALARYLP